MPKATRAFTRGRAKSQVSCKSADEPAHAQHSWKKAKAKISAVISAWKLPLPDPPGTYEEVVDGVVAI